MSTREGRHEYFSEFLEKYPVDKTRIPESYLDAYPFAKEIGCDPSLRDERLAPFPRTHRAIQTHRREYFAAITHLDSQIGRVLDHLKKSGQEDETIIFFTADHGLSIGHHGLMGKQNAYDVSVRVPFVIAGPGIQSRSKNSQPIYVQDAMATSIALSGAEKQDFVEFQDLRPMITGGKSKYTDGIYFAYLDLQRSINIDSMKLIEYPKANVSRLYDLKTDPQEMHDLAGLREYADQAKVLHTKLEVLALRYELKK